MKTSSNWSTTIRSLVPSGRAGQPAGRVGAERARILAQRLAQHVGLTAGDRGDGSGDRGERMRAGGEQRGAPAVRQGGDQTGPDQGRLPAARGAEDRAQPPAVLLAEPVGQPSDQDVAAEEPPGVPLLEGREPRVGALFVVRPLGHGRAGRLGGGPPARRPLLPVSAARLDVGQGDVERRQPPAARRLGEGARRVVRPLRQGPVARTAGLLAQPP
ncbi:hypothetical protein LUX73_19345 [Actinomadura madurae]|nr:hypothetical protein [Actinomadura madurae]MCQ0006601.1 hypothetical protein [Actinomadura madurae]